MTTKNLNIRVFQDSDQPAVVQLWRQVFSDKQPWNVPEEVLRRKREVQRDLIFVGESDRQIVATCLAGYDGIRGWLYRVAVAPDYRRRGWGRRIVQFALEALAAKGCPKVNLQVLGGNVDAVGFYRAIGFDEQDRHSLSTQLRQSDADTPSYKIVVDEELELTEFRPSDKTALLHHLNHTDDISRYSLTVPYPYTESDADGWLRFAAGAGSKEHKAIFAIRETANQSLLGAVGFKDLIVGHKGEIGYWVAPERWNQGIASRVVNRACAYGFEDLDLVRIAGHVFSNNPASSRVLEKCGFLLEGTRRAIERKGDELWDDLVYARLR